MSTGDQPHLCTLDEWHTACVQGADVGQIDLADMEGDREWVSQTYAGSSGIVMGLGDCSDIGTSSVNTPRAYRCCLR